MFPNNDESFLAMRRVSSQLLSSTMMISIWIELHFLLYTGFGQLHVVGRVWLEGFRLRCRLVWSLSTFYPLYNIYNFLVISDMPQSSSNVKVKNWRMLGVLIKEFGLFPLIDYKKLWMSNIIKLEEIFVTQQGKFCRTKLTEFQYCQK